MSIIVIIIFFLPVARMVASCTIETARLALVALLLALPTGQATGLNSMCERAGSSGQHSSHQLKPLSSDSPFALLLSFRHSDLSCERGIACPSPTTLFMTWRERVLRLRSPLDRGKMATSLLCHRQRITACRLRWPIMMPGKGVAIGTLELIGPLSVVVSVLMTRNATCCGRVISVMTG